MMKKIIHKMFEDKDLVLNTKTLEEAEGFTDAYAEVLVSLDLLEEEYLDNFRIGAICYNIYKNKTCFTLDTGTMQYADTKYFKDIDNSKIITVDEFASLYEEI